MSHFVALPSIITLVLAELTLGFLVGTGWLLSLLADRVAVPLGGLT